MNNQTEERHQESPLCGGNIAWMKAEKTFLCLILCSESWPKEEKVGSTDINQGTKMGRQPGPGWTPAPASGFTLSYGGNGEQDLL